MTTDLEPNAGDDEPTQPQPAVTSSVWTPPADRTAERPLAARPPVPPPWPYAPSSSDAPSDPPTAEAPSAEAVKRIHERAGHPADEVYEVPVQA